jgi:tetratricopeptide (TPR) repeat protein
LWRRIDLAAVNLALYLLLLLLIGLFHRQLGWAAGQVGSYLGGALPYPAEQELALRGRDLLDRDEPTAARELLERSLAIDPYSEAGYWLGLSFFEQGDLDRALELFTSYLAIDPTRLDAYLKVSAIHERRGDPPAAQRILGSGLTFFENQAAQLLPRPDPDQPAHHNAKALQAHERCTAAVFTLRREIARLGQGQP